MNGLCVYVAHKRYKTFKFFINEMPYLVTLFSILRYSLRGIKVFNLTGCSRNYFHPFIITIKTKLM